MLARILKNQANTILQLLYLNSLFRMGRVAILPAIKIFSYLLFCIKIQTQKLTILIEIILWRPSTRCIDIELSGLGESKPIPPHE